MRNVNSLGLIIALVFFAFIARTPSSFAALELQNVTMENSEVSKLLDDYFSGDIKKEDTLRLEWVLAIVKQIFDIESIDRISSKDRNEILSEVRSRIGSDKLMENVYHKYASRGLKMNAEQSEALQLFLDQTILLGEAWHQVSLATREVLQQTPPTEVWKIDGFDGARLITPTLNRLALEFRGDEGHLMLILQDLVGELKSEQPEIIAAMERVAVAALADPSESRIVFLENRMSRVMPKLPNYLNSKTTVIPAALLAISYGGMHLLKIHDPSLFHLLQKEYFPGASIETLIQTWGNWAAVSILSMKEVLKVTTKRAEIKTKAFVENTVDTQLGFQELSRVIFPRKSGHKIYAANASFS